MNRLQNKVAIITGAAGGMGLEEAKLFAREGASVLATDIDEERLKAWVLEAQDEGLKIEYCRHNVALRSDWELVVGKAVSLWGKIDILVNNAGIFPPGATTLSTDQESWDRVIAVNLTGPFIGTQLCIPHMQKAGGGSIVNIASIAGMVGGNGPAYTASKGGLRLLSKDNAVEFAPYNIRVNTIFPGGVLTPMVSFMTAMEGADTLMKESCPMGRIGEPREIALAALFLASDESSYTTGAELVIDGGLVAR